ncbi:putative lipid II flippase FtsW [Arthrobacter burdickii]|uniref:Probable peptidoglycan glycosyltransferase FtsW n=1 Tax=Arthrobacter burdickii TaxID=3035920 RepID=A0ABT8JZF5_9MICC|nr:putative lipid II flippase FtsW [Arthrobacter burdickii]MDN4609737.1 putative lipid II flippase FtsW [Arthrobacter burdickii]
MPSLTAPRPVSRPASARNPLSRGVRLWRALTTQGPSSNRNARNLLITTTFALVAIGLLMVLSASSVELVAAGKSPFDTFYKQLMWMGIGSAALVVCAFIPLRTYRRLAWLILLGSLVFSLLVFTPLGVEVQGNRNWIGIGSLTAQPSEFLKLSIILWGGAVLTRKAKLLGNWKHLFVPVAPGAMVAIGLVVAGKDLGTAMVLALIAVSLFFFAGASPKLFLGGLAVGVVGTTLAVVSSPNRMLRISAWLDPAAEGTAEGLGYQSAQALYGLAGGGVFGVGVGQSRQKVNWIPEAHNDFVFAILGEELGLVGALLVIVLFAVLAFSIYRISTLSKDLYVTYVCGGILVWIIGQAILNIAVVTGMIPVIGVPLPFISYGGSSMVAVLAAVGVLISCSRATDQDHPADAPA